MIQSHLRFSKGSFSHQKKLDELDDLGPDCQSDPAAGADNCPKAMVAVPPPHHAHLLYVIFRLHLHNTD